jgi:hypothetical protein
MVFVQPGNHGGLQLDCLNACVFEIPDYDVQQSSNLNMTCRSGLSQPYCRIVSTFVVSRLDTATGPPE